MIVAPAAARQALRQYEADLRGRALLLFDGRCILCNRSVRFLIRHDPAGRLRFAPMDSVLGAAMLDRHPEIPFFSRVDTAISPRTAVLILDPLTPRESVLVRSRAAVAALNLLAQPWPIAGKLLRVVPPPLRDFAYRLVARSRYRLFGRYKTCPVPGLAERGRILSAEFQ